MSAFIVAEAGCNHLGDRAKMLAFCDAAKACGADAVKFQAYDTSELAWRRGMMVDTSALLQVSAGVDVVRAGYVKKEHLETYSLLRKAELTDADLDAIAAHCKAIGFKHFYSVFDPSQVERVLSRGACALKIGHKEADYAELLMACVAQDRDRPWNDKRLFISGSNVHGVWEYPATSLPQLRDISEHGFCGFSSHYTDYRIPAAAALRGAEYIEFHVRLSDTDPEAAWSLSIEDATKCCKLIREYESWL